LVSKLNELRTGPTYYTGREPACRRGPGFTVPTIIHRPHFHLETVVTSSRFLEDHQVDRRNKESRNWSPRISLVVTYYQPRVSKLCDVEPWSWIFVGSVPTFYMSQ